MEGIYFLVVTLAYLFRESLIMEGIYFLVVTLAYLFDVVLDTLTNYFGHD